METDTNPMTEEYGETDEQTTKAVLKPPLARLVCSDASMDGSLEGLIIELEETEQTLGRAETNTVTIDSMRVSREHIRIYPENGHWQIEDLSSTNGVFVNKTQTSQARLNHGDKISIASIPFRFELEYNKAEIQPDTKPMVTPRSTAKQLDQNPEATIVMQNSPFFTDESSSPKIGWYIAIALIVLLTGALLTSILA
jgi:hypothetical protein